MNSVRVVRTVLKGAATGIDRDANFAPPHLIFPRSNEAFART